MATTKRRSTTKKSTSRKTSAKRDQSLAARTGRTIQNQPYVSAAIATGAVAAVAAAAAGAFFFRRSDKTIGEITDDIGERIRDGVDEARTVASSTTRKVKDKASAFFAKAEDKLDQSDLANEAMSLKQTGRKNSRPVDTAIESELKTGAASY